MCIRDRADVVLIGVSRTSKTPVSLYLAQRGYKVANVPLVPELSPPPELMQIPVSYTHLDVYKRQGA